MTARPPKDLEQLLAEEPFVRGLARALVADDADEVVQQTWLQALDSRGEVREPRSWLARVVHNAARNLRRSRRRQQQRERAAAVCERLPSSAELLLREERRRALVLAVDALPAPLRTVVLLRWFEDLPPRRIAAELGLPVATVWNQLRRALQLLRERLDAEHGGERRAWLLPLVPVAAVRAKAAGVLGGLLMTAKAKTVAAAAVLLALALGIALRQPPGSGLETNHAAGVSPALADARGTAVPPVDAPSLQREVVTGAATATTGSLVVRVRYLAPDEPAAQRPVLIGRVGSSARVDGRQFMTDAAGDLRLDGIAPGRVYASDLLARVGEEVEVKAGATAEIGLQIRPGVQIDGIVVDEYGLPVAGALVEYALLASTGDVRAAAVTDARGEFLLRDCFEHCFVGARAAGRAAAPMRLLSGRRDAKVSVRIELSLPGGQVEGEVVRTDGRPVPQAWLCVGSGPLSFIQSEVSVPAIVRSDADGRFTAPGLWPGTQPVRVLAAGCAPWEGSCEVVASATTSLRVVLQDGITCTGIVRGRDAVPVAGARIEVRAFDSFEHATAESAADGSFRLADLRAGAVLRARHKDGGHATAVVYGGPGVAVVCDLQLEFGVDMRGRVVDESGAPLATWMHFSAAGNERVAGWAASAISGADGCFALADVPTGRLLTAQVSGDLVDTTVLDHLDAGAGELVLRVKRMPPASAHLTGHVVTPDGRPLANAQVQLASGGESVAWTDAQGAFDLQRVRPGRRQVLVQHRDHLLLTSDEREVAADSACDFGELRLSPCGTMRAVGAGLSATDCAILDATGVLPTLAEGTLRSVPFAPGNYTLRVRRQGREQSIPFAITAGTETRVEVPAR